MTQDGESNQGGSSSGGSGGGRRGRNSRRRGPGGGGSGSGSGGGAGSGQQGQNAGPSVKQGQQGQSGGRRPQRGASSNRQSGSNRQQGPSGQQGGQKPNGQKPNGQKLPGKQKFSPMDPRYVWDEKSQQAAIQSAGQLTKQSKRYKYGILIYETFAEAKADALKLQTEKSNFDRLNIVIRQEGSMDDPELIAFGKVFAGAAWALIHDRRVTDGWYNELQE